MRYRRHSLKNFAIPKEFVIDRSRWRVGGDEHLIDELGETALVTPGTGNQKSTMCCLGFFGHACGAGTAEMENEYDPRQSYARLKNKTFEGWKWFKFMGENDEIQYTCREREQRVKRLFAEKGIKVKFVGKYPQRVLSALRKAKNGKDK